MPITATVIEDSVSPAGIRLTTLLLRYPRFIHAELMTHRVFSRNSSSSRAIPVERLIADLERDPAMPVYWGKHQPGMQADEELDRHAIEKCRMLWLAQMRESIKAAAAMREHGLHKQIANRILEPWAHINVVVTATEWDNFIELRCHKDAQPEIYALGCAMREAMEESTPKLLTPGQWHLPFVTEADYDHLNTAPDEKLTTDPDGISKALKISVARCARTSYLTFDGKPPEPEKDLKLYDKLVGARPLHASPAEHQATPDALCPDGQSVPGVTRDQRLKWEHADEHANFVGWRQHRKILEKEIWE